MLSDKWYNFTVDENGELQKEVRQITKETCGIYFDMPIEVYHSQKAVSCSGIKQLLKNPFAYWSTSPLNKNKKEFMPSAAMISGQKFHKFLLEGKDFFNDYEIKKGVNKSTAIAPNGKIYIGEGELQDITNAANAIADLIPNTCNRLLAGAKTEVSMFWIDEETGILCRCRHDIFKPEVSTDYKTIDDISYRNCLKALTNYDYILQAAFYLDGNKAVFEKHLTRHVKKKLNLTEEKIEKIKEHTNFCFLFQEKKAPFTPLPIILEDDLLKIGRENYRQGLNIYLECLEKYGENEPWKPFDDKVFSVDCETLDFYGCGFYKHKNY